jgi:hypothetical protein
MPNQNRGAQKAPYDIDDLGRDRIFRKTQHDYACVSIRRILPDIGEIQIARQDDCMSRLRAPGYLIVGGCGHSDIAGEFDFVSERLHARRQRARQVRIDQQAHSGYAAGSG